MSQRFNEHGQPIGQDVPGWQIRNYPPRKAASGIYARIEPLNADLHCDMLFEAYSRDTSGALWTYMPVGPFANKPGLRAWLDQAEQSEDPLFYAIIDIATGQAVGVASYLRIQPEVGVIEVGNIAFSPLLQRTPVATEAMYLMMKRAFEELGYRRYEWKCDALNAPSRRAAARFGFTPDGLFEQALVYKGRNRDTAWFSILDRDWPEVRQAFETWLSPENFASDGTQLQSLSDLIHRLPDARFSQPSLRSSSGSKPG